MLSGDVKKPFVKFTRQRIFQHHFCVLQASHAQEDDEVLNQINKIKEFVEHLAWTSMRINDII